MRLSFLSLTITVLAMSCSSKKAPHVDVVNYFSKIHQSIQIPEKQNRFVVELGKALTVSMEGSADIDFNKMVNSLQLHYEEILVSFDQRLTETGKITNVDPDFGLKGLVTDMLQKAKKLHMLSHVLVFELIPNKFENRTEGQKAALKNFKEFSQEFNDEMSSPDNPLKQKMTDFQSKYGIRDDEISSAPL
jgi:hypothetical protein